MHETLNGGQSGRYKAVYYQFSLCYLYEYVCMCVLGKIKYISASDIFNILKRMRADCGENMHYIKESYSYQDNRYHMRKKAFNVSDREVVNQLHIRV